MVYYILLSMFLSRDLRAISYELITNPSRWLFKSNNFIDYSWYFYCILYFITATFNSCEFHLYVCCSEVRTKQQTTRFALNFTIIGCQNDCCGNIRQRHDNLVLVFKFDFRRKMVRSRFWLQIIYIVDCRMWLCEHYLHQFSTKCSVTTNNEISEKVYYMRDIN